MPQQGKLKEATIVMVAFLVLLALVVVPNYLASRDQCQFGEREIHAMLTETSTLTIFDPDEPTKVLGVANVEGPNIGLNIFSFSLSDGNNAFGAEFIIDGCTLRSDFDIPDQSGWFTISPTGIEGEWTTTGTAVSWPLGRPNERSEVPVTDTGRWLLQ